MNCFFDDNPARGVCRFCGRAVCKDHADKRMPYITSVYVGANNSNFYAIGRDAAGNAVISQVISVVNP